MVSERPVAELIKEREPKLKEGIYVVHGSEEFLHKKLVEKLKKSFGTVRTIFGGELKLEDFPSLLGEKSLFGGSKSVVILQEGEKFFSKLRKKQKEKLARLLRRKVSNVLFILITVDLKKGDLSKEPYKTLFSVAEGVFSAKPLSRKQMAAAILNRFKKEGIVPEKGVIEYLLESFADLASLKMELEKLITYAKGQKKLTLSEVKELVEGNPQYTVFDLQSTYFERDLRRTLKTFEGLLEGLTAYERNALCLQIEGLFLSTLNRLLVAIERTSKGENLKSFAREIGLHYPFQVIQFERWLQVWDKTKIVSSLRSLYKFDLNVKTKFLPAEEEMRRFLYATLSED